MRLYLTLPDLQELNLDHTDDVRVKEFSGEQISINAAGDFELKTMVKVKEFNLAGLEGVEVEFTGSADVMNVQLENESRLDTDRGSVGSMRLSANNGSRIKLKQGVQILEQEISENSSLRVVN